MECGSFSLGGSKTGVFPDQLKRVALKLIFPNAAAGAILAHLTSQHYRCPAAFTFASRTYSLANQKTNQLNFPELSELAFVAAAGVYARGAGNTVPNLSA
jgi:hypothetical protein